MKIASCKGYSLVELLVSVAISGLALYVLSKAVTDVFKDSKIILEHSQSKIEGSIVMGFVQKTIIRSDVTLYGFNGAGIAAKPLARFVLPSLDVCADRSTACLNKPSIMWGVFDNRKPIISVACALSADTLIVDLKNNEQGNLNLVGDTIQVDNLGSDYPKGDIDLGINELVGLLDEPIGTAFKVSSPPAPYDPVFNAGLGTFSDPLFGNNSDCLKNISEYDDLVKFKISPLILPGTGATLPTAATILKTLGAFPLRLVNIKVYNLGLETTAMPTSLALRKCNYNYLCPDIVITEDKIEGFNIQVILGVLFNGDTKMKPFSIADSTLCTVPNCRILKPIPPLKYLLPGELETQILPSGFSLVKMDNIRSLDFYVEKKTTTSMGDLRSAIEVYHATTF